MLIKNVINNDNDFEIYFDVRILLIDSIDLKNSVVINKIIVKVDL